MYKSSVQHLINYLCLSVFQVQMMWHSEYWHFVAIWQCSTPWCSCNTYNHPNLKSEYLAHPPYYSELTPSDFHVFGPLKEVLRGKSFKSNEEVTQAMDKWLQSQLSEFFSRGIHAFSKCWNTCIIHHGGYVKTYESVFLYCSINYIPGFLELSLIHI